MSKTEQINWEKELNNFIGEFVKLILFILINNFIKKRKKH